MIDPKYKSDMEQARENLLAWWAGEDIGRPVLLLRAPSGERPMPSLFRPMVDDVPAPADLVASWTDPEYHVANARVATRMVAWIGEAVPWYCVNTGPGCLAAALGCPVSVRDADTVWFEHRVTSWEDALPIVYDRAADWWQRTKDLTEALVKHADGRYLVSVADVSGVGDLVAAMRGPAEMCMDIAERSDALKQAIAQVTAIWEAAVDEIYDLLKWRETGTIQSMGIWHPKRTYFCQNDFSALIGPDQFRAFCLPAVAAQCRKVEGALYHLDGKEAIHSLDALLEIDELAAIQWEPGEVGPEPGDAAWLPLYRRIQEAGKGLVIYPQPESVERVCRALSRKGLVIGSRCKSVEQAEHLLASSYKWSHA